MTDVLLVDSTPRCLAELESELCDAPGLSVREAQDPQRLTPAELKADWVVCAAANCQQVLSQIDAGRCLVVDHEGDARLAVAAMKAGVADYFVAPFDTAELTRCLTPKAATAERLPLNIVGSSPPMLALFEHVRRVGPTESAVLIEGETGTGKELVARALHSVSTRKHAPLITLNCATTPEQLIEVELFGYPNDDGAPSNRGLLHAAHGGTLFLDEIGELPPAAQARLQRLLAEHTESTVDVRIISATHRDLRQLVGNERFREDLYYRINVVSLAIPPLRERGEDIISIAEFFLEQITQKLTMSCAGLSASAREVMQEYHWPGNVRELENAIERAVILCNQGEISADLLAIDVSPPTRDLAAPPSADQTSLEDYFVSFVNAHQDHLTETELAQKLGISRKSLWERRQRLNIPRKRTKKRGRRRDDA